MQPGIEPLFYHHPIYKLALSLTDILDYQMSPNLKKTMNTKVCPTTNQIIHCAKWTSVVLFLLTFRLALISHQWDICADGGIVMELKDNWFCSGLHTISDQIISQCTAYKSHQVFRRNQPVLGSLPRPTLPLAVLQMDFKDLPPALGHSHCMVLVYVFSGWTECYRTRCADATIVVKADATTVVKVRFFLVLAFYGLNQIRELI